MALRGPRRLLTTLVVALLAATFFSMSVLASPARATVSGLDEGRFVGTARLPNCSASVVRWASALDQDPAVVLTNGHCVLHRFLGAREVLVDQKQYKLIELLDGRGKVAMTVRGVHLRYASMYRTDLAIYELRESYADLAAGGVTPLTLAARGPSRSDRIRIPSGYWVEQRSCVTAGTVHRLHEREWDWWGSIRLPARDGCAIRGGYSGAPIVDRTTGKVVGVANTAYVGGRRCVDSACEENKRGVVRMVRHMNYGQQTSWITTCIGADRRFDLHVPGCRLARPRA